MHIKFSKINFYLRFPKSLDVYWPNLSENAQSVQGVPFQTPPGTLSAPNRARCPDFRTCWTCFAGNLVQVSRFPHLLDMFCGESCPAVPVFAPAGTGPSGRSLRKFGCWLNIADEGCLVDLLLQYQVEVCCKEWGFGCGCREVYVDSRFL